MNVFDVLKSAYNPAIAGHVLDAYREIEQNFVLKKWKPSELDAGHFVESVRRLLELELTGKHTPFNKPLPRFNDQALLYYEHQSGHESYRLLIPRVLKAIYNIRSKRGVAHISDVSPNEVDSTLILHCVKWILSEIVRLKSGLSVQDTQKLMHRIVERQIPLIWKDADVTRILDASMSARDQVLVLLYDKSPQSVEKLREMIEYKNETNFKKILRRLHTAKLIHHGSDTACLISPTGVLAAENIIKNSRSLT